MSNWLTTMSRKTPTLTYDTSRPSTLSIIAKKGSPIDVSLRSARSYWWSLASPSRSDLPRHQAEGPEGEKKRWAFGFIYKKGKSAGYCWESDRGATEGYCDWLWRRGRRECWPGARKENEVWSSLFHMNLNRGRKQADWAAGDGETVGYRKLNYPWIGKLFLLASFLGHFWPIEI